jgi:hypothetical protein
VFSSADHLRTITHGLGLVVHTCELQGHLRLFDDHVLAQRFFCRILNSAYQLQLQQMDQIQDNYPAIDLGDPVNRVAYQITAEKSGEKVQHTLDKFIEHGLEKQYDTLRILVIGKRQTTYKTVTVPLQLGFDCDRDIIGIAELTKQISALDTSRLGELSGIIVEELKLRQPTATTSRKRVAFGAVIAGLALGVTAPIWIAASSVQPPMVRLPLGSRAPRLAPVKDAYAGYGNEFRTWEEMTSKDQRENLLAFTDRFTRCPQFFVIRDPPASTTGIRFDLDIKRGANSGQLIVRDVVVEVVRYHSVAPTFLLGAGFPKKPVIIVEMWNRRSPLPWTFHAKSIAEEINGPFHEFEGTQTLVTRLDWETFLLKLEVKDRGIYEFNIDVILQQDDEAQTSIRVTQQPLVVGFFSRPPETHPDYKFLHDRYMARGGMIRQLVDEDDR